MTQIIVVVIILIMRNRISDKTNLRSLRARLTGMLYWFSFYQSFFFVMGKVRMPKARFKRRASAVPN